MDLDEFIKNMQKEESKNESSDSGTSPLKYLPAEYLKEYKEHKLRIIPNLQDPNGLPFEQVFVHFNYRHPEMKDQSGNPKNWVFGCLGSECPLCKHSKTFEKDSQNQKDTKASVQFNWYVYDENNNPKKLVLSYSAHTTLKDAVLNIGNSGQNPIGVKAGKWFYLKKEKMPDKVKYSASVGDEDATVPDSILKIMETLTPLAELTKKPTVQELQNVLNFKLGKGSQNSSSQEDDIPAPDLSLPEDDLGSDEFSFDDLSVDLGDDDLD